MTDGQGRQLGMLERDEAGNLLSSSPAADRLRAAAAGYCTAG
jgi:hypothetical protein